MLAVLGVVKVSKAEAEESVSVVEEERWVAPHLPNRFIAMQAFFELLKEREGG